MEIREQRGMEARISSGAPIPEKSAYTLTFGHFVYSTNTEYIHTKNLPVPPQVQLMDRHKFFQFAGLVFLIVSTGCVNSLLMPGSNDTLEIRNQYGENATIHITIWEGLGSKEEVVFNERVHIQKNTTRTLDVLGDSQYYLNVSMGNEWHEFGNRPICQRAFTRVIIQEDGKLYSQIEDCE